MEVRQLLRFRKRVPVLIIERNQIGRRLYLFKKYAHKPLFIGRLPVLSILMLGLCGYMLYFGDRYHAVVQNEILNLFTRARIDDMAYQVVDFFEKKGQLMIYVISRR